MEPLCKRDSDLNSEENQEEHEQGNKPHGEDSLSSVSGEEVESQKFPKRELSWISLFSCLDTKSVREKRELAGD